MCRKNNECASLCYFIIHIEELYLHKSIAGDGSLPMLARFPLSSEMKMLKMKPICCCWYFSCVQVTRDVDLLSQTVNDQSSMFAIHIFVSNLTFLDKFSLNARGLILNCAAHSLRDIQNFVFVANVLTSKRFLSWNVYKLLANNNTAANHWSFL